MPKTLTTHIFEFCRARQLKFSDFLFNDKIKQWKFHENLQCSPWRLWSSWYGMILKQEWISGKAAVTNTTIFSIRDIPRFFLIKFNVHKYIYIYIYNNRVYMYAFFYWCTHDFGHVYVDTYLLFFRYYFTKFSKCFWFL